ncbi:MULTISPECIES: hypothetical protein [unclassified Synechocystis]|uniref:hypothetical protein n=1 Tax=unclassified Synechocystis TaxID=2640012 RepID=UPI00041C5BE5|nr:MULTISPECIES: hypothetical protein [unclassified Synechocystis]AIE73215.1 hypothetical protein D082_06860 [Synechocystis sp. PCC 6714]MCT0254272.1 hypothetical protein [Synechocystis sp. CS-94]
MNIITQFVDRLTQFIFGVQVFRLIEKCRQTNKFLQDIDYLVRRKKIVQATRLAKSTLSIWESSPSGLEKWIRNQFLGNKLELLSTWHQQWQQDINRAKELIRSADQLVEIAKNNPCDQQSLPNLNKAQSLYQQAEQIVYDETLERSINNLNNTIQKHEQFQEKLINAEQLASQLYFKKALVIINEAKAIIPTSQLDARISDYNASIEREEKYENNLKKARLLATNNQLEASVELCKNSLLEFRRSDGKNLLQKLTKIIDVQAKVRQAITLEKKNNFEEAKIVYSAVVEDVLSIDQSFNISNIQLKLATIYVKTQKYQEAFLCLAQLNCDTSAYLKGFIYASLKEWQQASREWRKIQNPEIKEQLNILKDLIKRDRLISIQDIEVDLKNLEHQSALNKSQLFLQKFGSDSIVERNMAQHIEPWLIAEHWNKKGSKELIDLSEKEWLENPSITTLHNLTIALHEQITQNDEADLSLFAKFICLWFTLLANLEHNPKLHDIVWMDTENINFETLQSKLVKLVDDLIEKFKQKDPIGVEGLKDGLRLELMVLNTLQETNLRGMKFNQLTILPGCYYQYSHLFSNLNFPNEQLSALYSDWGFAVAACLDNHILRAIHLKPIYPPQSPAEIYSSNFVNYHEGRYHLQQFDWRRSIKSLNNIKSCIQSNSEWRENIDQLCSAQRRKIDDFSEHLEFAEFWYDLLQSQNSRSYLAEYKAEAIRQQWAKDKISNDSALENFNQLKKIDPHNPVVLELCQKVKDYQDAQKFDKLIKAGNVEGLVNFAKNSSNPKIRFAAAELFIDIAIKGAENRSMDADGIRQLGKWAYEIAPHEPAFREFYRALRIPY